jgi:hypothetical protein
MSAILAPPRLESIGEWMAREGKLLHQQRGYIPFLARDYQRKFWNDTSQLRIVKKARQIGFSQAVSAEALERAMQRTCTILIVSKDEEAAKQVLNYAKITYHNLRVVPVLLSGENTRQMEFANGSKIISLTSSPNTGRSISAAHVYIDEAAFVRWFDAIYRAIAPTVSAGGTITILSSPDGTENLFGRIWEGRNNGRGPVRDFDGTPAPDGVWYNNEKWIRANHPDYVQKYPPDQWASEFEASLVSSGDRVFRVEKLDAMIEDWAGLELTNGYPWDDPNAAFVMPPLPNRIYMNAWDLGRKRDYTVGVTLDVTEDVHHVVCFERFLHLPWDEQQERIIAREYWYPGYNAMDATGVGDPVHQALEQSGHDIMPFIFSRVTKPNVVNELKRSTEFGLIKHGIAQMYDEMYRYQYKDEDLVQDCVMALGMAEYLSRHLDLEQQMDMEDRVDDVSRAFGEW